MNFGALDRATCIYADSPLLNGFLINRSSWVRECRFACYIHNLFKCTCGFGSNPMPWWVFDLYINKSVCKQFPKSPGPCHTGHCMLTMFSWLPVCFKLDLFVFTKITLSILINKGTVSREKVSETHFSSRILVIASFASARLRFSQRGLYKRFSPKANLNSSNQTFSAARRNKKVSGISIRFC